MNFDEWFERNKEDLARLLRDNPEEALYRAWFAGYNEGLDRMVDHLGPFVNPFSNVRPETGKPPNTVPPRPSKK